MPARQPERRASHHRVPRAAASRRPNHREAKAAARSAWPKAKASGKSPERFAAEFRAERLARAKQRRKRRPPRPRRPTNSEGAANSRSAAREGDISASDLLCGFAPGTRPFVAPHGHGQAGARRVEVHLPDALHAQRLAAKGPQRDRPVVRRPGERSRDRLVTTNTANVRVRDSRATPTTTRSRRRRNSPATRSSSACIRTCTCAAKRSATS